MTCVMRLFHGRARALPYEGEYVREYNPDIFMMDFRNNMTGAWLVTTKDKTKAMQFSHPLEAYDLYDRVSKLPPYKKPLTYFNIVIEGAEELK